MAKLTVATIVEDTMSAPGNMQPTYLVVSVEDANGAPVAGLAIPNFAIGSEIVGPGGSTSHISAIAPGKLPGVYLLSLLPLAGQSWKAGVYIFSVVVNHGADKGHALCSCLMD